MIKALDKRSDFLFPTQVVSGEIPDFDQIQKKLIKWIYDYKEKNVDIARISNKGGWQSARKDVFVDKGFKEFENIIIPIIGELISEFKIVKEADIVQMWINVNGKNAYIVSHSHPFADFSGVLWIKQTPKQGRFIFDNIDVGYRDATILYNIDSKYLEEKRNNGEIGSSLEAELDLECNDKILMQLNEISNELKYLFITSKVNLDLKEGENFNSEIPGLCISIKTTDLEKCARCWHHVDSLVSYGEDNICLRCEENITGKGETRFFI